MSSGRICGFAIVGAVAGAVLGAALLASPAAYADDIETLPLLPFAPANVSNPHGFVLGFPPAEEVSQTPIEQSTIPFGIERQWDDNYILADGNYQTHFDAQDYGVPDWYYHDSQVVTASDGVAPPVGTELDHTDFYLPSWGFSFQFDTTTSLTTPDGTVDVSTLHYIPFVAEWSNEFYNGPAGIFDDLVSPTGTTVIPLIDIPAGASSGAAADFSALLPDVLGTL